MRLRSVDLETFSRFAVALEDASDRQAVAAVLLDTLTEAVSSLGNLLLLTGGRGTVVLAQRGLGLAPGAPAPVAASSIVVHAQTSRTTLLVPGFDVAADEWLTATVRAGGRHMVVPLMVDDECVGVLVAQYRARSGSRAERGLIAVVERFASHGALALRNAARVEEMERMSNMDGLTRIANHRTLQTHLQKELARSIRTREPVSLVMIDVDNFTSLNDICGDQVGDEVLRQVAIALQASSREFDTVARYGGDAFAVVLPGCGPDDATRSADRFRRLVSEGVTKVSVTASVGVASAPHNAETVQELVQAAGDALYAARRAGGNRVRRAIGIGEAEIIPDEDTTP